MIRARRSTFGRWRVGFARHNFIAPGQTGLGPLDAEWSGPARCDADLLRAWAVEGTTDASDRESPTGLERILGLSRSVHALQTGVPEAAAAVAGLCAASGADRPPARRRDAGGAGRGPRGAEGAAVPPEAARAPGKGQKRGTQKEAVVTGRDTIAPSPRPPQDVGAALLQTPAARRRRPAPSRSPKNGGPPGRGKRSPGAGWRSGRRSARGPRASRGGRSPLALGEATAGGNPLSGVHLAPGHHAGPEYRGDAAKARLGETHAQRRAGVRAYLEALVAGQTDAVITAWEAEVQDPTCTGTPRQAVRRTGGYYQRNRPYMPDDDDLARGLPIGTGGVEGACGHLVKDRMEPSGMRGTQAGAQAGRDLRAVRLNGPWETSWQWHRQPPHQRVYAPSAPAPATVEAQALMLAA